MAVILLLLGGLVAAGRWWTTPDVFPDSGAGMRLDPRPVARAAVAFGVTAPLPVGEAESTTVTFTDSAAVDLAANSAAATTEVSVCRARPGADVVGAVPAAELGELCDEVEVVADGVRLVLSPWDARERDYVIVTLTPTRPGKVRLSGVSLSYRTERSHLYRRGEDAIAMHAVLTAR